MITRIRNMKIGLKLYILLGIALAGMLVIGGLSFNLMGKLNEKTTDISTSWLPSVDTARNMTATLTDIRLHELGCITATNEGQEPPAMQLLKMEKVRWTHCLPNMGN